MLNKDLFQAANAEALANLSQALKSDDTEAATKLRCKTAYRRRKNILYRIRRGYARRKP